MSRTVVCALALSLVAMSAQACGGSEESESDDAGDGSDVGTPDGDTPDVTGPVFLDGGPTRLDGGFPELDATVDATADAFAMDADYVDAGYYNGDGSYWVDGGAYPPTPDASVQDAASSGGDAADASTACGALSACCASLSGGAQSLCESVVTSGDDTNCAAETAQLESGGNCTGVTILASQIQVPAHRIVSDGTTLFFTTFEASPGLLAMPVGGGEITTLLSAEAGDSTSFLAVDDANVYVLEGNSLIRIPKNGAPPTLLSEAGAVVTGATSLGDTAYWVETTQTSGMIDPSIVVKSAPLLGGPIATLASLVPNSPDIDQIAVTSRSVFIGLEGATLFEVSQSAAGAAGGPCAALASDTSAIYCSATAGSNVAIADDGTTTVLGPAVSSSLIVSDDTYVYWVDATMVGSVMRAPKSGGGNATVLARDSNPIAIAVDAHSVYWSDQDGYIKSVPK